MRHRNVLSEEGCRALHTFASVLTGDPRRAESLVVDAVGSARGRAAVRGGRTRDLVAAVYRTWAADPASGPVLDPASPAALGALPAEQRAALALCALGDHTYRQAATVLDLPAARVAALLRTALLSLDPAPVR